jgi:hypothetical protein
MILGRNRWTGPASESGGRPCGSCPGGDGYLRFIDKGPRPALKGKPGDDRGPAKTTAFRKAMSGIKPFGAPVGLLVVLLMAAGLPARAEFQPHLFPGRDRADFNPSVVSVPAETYSTGAEARPRPWIAAAEVTGINIGVWTFDRYALNRDYAHISWSSVKHNLSEGFILCPDTFPTSFFGHPYHGSQYFNAARSLGMPFWESIPYSAGGYLTWGFIFENDLPSFNDLVMTTLGGMCLGELEYRLSSQVLDDSAVGGARVGREILAFLIDPIRGFNRLIYGDLGRTGSINRQRREPLQGYLALGGQLVSDSFQLTRLRFSPGLGFEVVYGMDSSDIVSGHPFDLIFLSGGVRTDQKKGYFDLSTYGPWMSREWEGGRGSKYLVGLFQHFDYLNNEVLHLGGTSTTAGFVSLVPLGGGAVLRGSVQAGGLLLGGVKNQYVHVEDRDYNYGLGATAKIEAWLSHPSLGTLSVHFSRFWFKAVHATGEVDADESHDGLTLLQVRYSVPFSSNWAIALDYGLFARRQSFEGHPDASGDLSRVGLALEWHL